MRALLFLLHAAVTTLKIASDAIVSAFWHLNRYGAIVASFFVRCYRTWKFLVFDHAKLPWSTKALSLLVLYKTTYLCKSGFSSLLHLTNKYWNCLNPSNRDAREQMHGGDCAPYRFNRGQVEWRCHFITISLGDCVVCQDQPVKQIYSSYYGHSED